jgi:NTE family protein
VNGAPPPVELFGICYWVPYGDSMARDGSWPDRSHRTLTLNEDGTADLSATAFVLPGGSTRGAAQVGMLMALTEAGVKPDLVVGTSVGALNAACYAADPTLAGLGKIDRLWVAAPRSQIFPLSVRSIVSNLRHREGYVLPNDGLRRWIADNTRHARLDEFPIPIHAVATDAETGQAVVLSSGDTVTALLASAAIPGVFPPVLIDGARLYDGAVAADTPIAQAAALGATTIYVLSTTAPDPVQPAVWRILDRLFGQPAVIEEPSEIPGVAVHVLPAPRASGNPYSFRSSRQLIDEARALARTFLSHHAGSPTHTEAPWPSLTRSTPSSMLRPTSA